MPTGKLILQRTSPNDIKIRDLYVRIDDQPEINLQYNQSIEIDLQPGSHIIKATNRLFSDKHDFQVSASETITFLATNEASGCVIALLWGIGMPFYKLTLQRIL